VAAPSSSAPLASSAVSEILAHPAFAEALRIAFSHLQGQGSWPFGSSLPSIPRLGKLSSSFVSSLWCPLVPVPLSEGCLCLLAPAHPFHEGGVSVCSVVRCLLASHPFHEGGISVCSVILCLLALACPFCEGGLSFHLLHTVPSRMCLSPSVRVVPLQSVHLHHTRMCLPLL
jgi:hypothetical protein